MEPAMFSVASMFGSDSGDDEEDNENMFQERDHRFPGMALRIREFQFHQVNANLLWPGASIFAEWIVQHEGLVRERRILELGSGTGALAIFLKKRWDVDITTSDYDDVDIENNIKYNCHLNGLDPLPHIRHTWGESFPFETPDWDLIIASDILLYVKSYPHLIQTLCLLLPLEGAAVEEQSSPTSSKIASSTSRDNFSLTKRTYEVPDVALIHRLAVGSNSKRSHGSEVMSSAYPPAARKPDPKIEVMSSSSDKPHLDSQLPRDKSAAVLGFLPKRCFLMSWRRRIPRQEEVAFFDGCRNAGFIVNDLRSRVFCIHRPSQQFFNTD